MFVNSHIIGHMQDISIIVILVSVVVMLVVTVLLSVILLVAVLVLLILGEHNVDNFLKNTFKNHTVKDSTKEYIKVFFFHSSSVPLLFICFSCRILKRTSLSFKLCVFLFQLFFCVQVNVFLGKVITFFSVGYICLFVFYCNSLE